VVCGLVGFDGFGVSIISTIDVKYVINMCVFSHLVYTLSLVYCVYNTGLLDWYMRLILLGLYIQCINCHWQHDVDSIGCYNHRSNIYSG
jgi:hypothetical protein